MDYDRLDQLAVDVAKGDLRGVGVLSTGEKLYVALAANSVELLEREDYTIAEAIGRLGAQDTAVLIERWRYAGNPKKQG